jgi:hypothetical protein
MATPGLIQKLGASGSVGASERRQWWGPRSLLVSQRAYLLPTAGRTTAALLKVWRAFVGSIRTRLDGSFLIPDAGVDDA